MPWVEYTQDEWEEKGYADDGPRWDPSANRPAGQAEPKPGIVERATSVGRGLLNRATEAIAPWPVHTPAEPPPAPPRGASVASPSRQESGGALQSLIARGRDAVRPAPPIAPARGGSQLEAAGDGADAGRALYTELRKADRGAVDRISDWAENQARRQVGGARRLAELGVAGYTNYAEFFWDRLAKTVRRSGGGGSEEASEWFEARAKGARSTGKGLYGREPEGFTEEVISGVAEAPYHLAEIAGPAKLLGPTAGLAVHGAAGGYAEDGESGALLGAGQGAATGKLVHLANMLDRVVRAPALGGLFGALTTSAGGDAAEIATETVVGGALGLAGPSKPSDRGARPRPGLMGDITPARRQRTALDYAILEAQEAGRAEAAGPTARGAAPGAPLGPSEGRPVVPRVPPPEQRRDATQPPVEPQGNPPEPMRPLDRPAPPEAVPPVPDRPAAPPVRPAEPVVPPGETPPKRPESGTAPLRPEVLEPIAAERRRPGSETEVLAGEEKLKARYELVELQDLQPSHSAETFQRNPRYAVEEQQRAYERDPNEQAKVIRNAAKFDPERIYDPGKDATTGPPIITESGQVLGGNGRTMMLSRVEAENPGSLKASALGMAERLGIDPAAATDMRAPVPVRVVEKGPATEGDFQRVSALLNVSQAQEVAPTAFSVNAAKRMTGSTVRSIADTLGASEDAITLKAALRGNRDIVAALERDGIIDNQNRSRFVETTGDRRGTLNEEGQRLVERAFLSKVVPDNAVQDGLPDGFRSKLARSAPEILRIESEHPEFKILDQVADVARSEVGRSSRKVAPEMYFEQEGLFASALDPSQQSANLRQIHQYMLERPANPKGLKDVAESFRKLGEMLDQQKSAAADLFGHSVRPEDVYRVAFKTEAPASMQQLQALAARLGGTAAGHGNIGYKLSDQLPSVKGYDVLVYRNLEGDTHIVYRPSKGAKYKLPELVAKTREDQVAIHRALGEEVKATSGPPAKDPLDAPLRKAPKHDPKELSSQSWKGPGDSKWDPGSRYVSPRDVEATPPDQRIPRKLRTKNGILFDLAKALKLPMQQEGHRKKIPDGQLGYYQPTTGQLRIHRYGDIQTGAHEISHALAERHKAFKDLYDPKKLTPEETAELSSISYDKGSILEGSAELLRLWMTNRETLPTRAPRMMVKLEAAIETLPRKHRKALYRARDEMHEHFNLGGRASLEASLGPDGLPTSSVLESSMDRWRQQNVDDLHSILRMERTMFGGELPEGAYQTARRLRGIPEIGREMMRTGHPVLEGGNVRFEGRGIFDILKPVAGKDHTLRDFWHYSVAKQALEMESQGIRTGLSRRGIHEALELRHENPKFDRVFGDLVEYQSKVADFAQAAGLFNSKQRENWRRQQYAFSFHREISGAEGRPGVGKPLASTSGIHRMRGSSRNLRDPFLNLVEGPTRMVQLALENQARRRVADLATKDGGGMFLRPIPTRSEKVRIGTERIRREIETQLENSGLSGVEGKPVVHENLFPFLDLWVGGKEPLGRNVMTVLRDGKPSYYEVFDQGLVRSLEAFRRPADQGVVQAMAAMRRMVQGTITLTPDFIARNFGRDALMASVMTRTGTQHVTTSWSGLKSAMVQDKHYRDFIANGGGGGTLHEGPRALRRDLRRHAKRMGISPKDIIMSPADVVRAMDWIGRAVELGPRIGEYKRAVRQGHSPAEAAYMGREISTDFAVKGGGQGIMPFMAKTVPFFNAMVASGDRFYRGLRHDPNGKVNTAAKIGMVAMMSMALRGYNEQLEEYQDRPNWEKMAYWMFPKISGEDENGRPIVDGFYRMPKIWEVGAIASAAERTLVSTLEGDDQELGEDLLQILMSNFNISLPAAIQPLAEQATNTIQFTGSPIVTRGMQSVEPWMQSRPDTAAVLQEGAEALRGTPLEFSPVRAEALLRGYFNHYFSYAALLTDSIADPNRAARHPDDFPLLKSFYARSGKYSRYDEAFYTALDEAKRASGTARELQKRGRDDAVVDEYIDSPKRMMSRQLEAMDRSVSGINRQMREVKRDPTMTPKEKRAELDYLESEKKAIRKEGVLLYRESLEEYE